jgi:uncharacterized protein YbjT (DUF2867 family)
MATNAQIACGGSGNLGQALVPRLIDKGDTPVILDVRDATALE